MGLATGKRKRSGTSPTKRSLDKLRADGYLVAVVEHWNPFAKIRQDLFGFVDLIALRGEETLAVQCTSYPNVAARVTKIAEHENIGAVRKAGWRVLVHGWHNKGGRWYCREVDCS